MAIKLPLLQSKDVIFNQFQVLLAKALQPITSLPNSDSVILTDIDLASTGVNNVPHKLNRNLTGWYVIRQDAQADIWDSQDSNTTPSQTLALNASANVTVTLIVF